MDKNLKKYDHVIILASGSGDRVRQYTVNNRLPKILMSIGNETIFSSMMKNINEISKQTSITLLPQHIGIVENVDDLTYRREPFFIECSSLTGTGHALYEALLKIKDEHYLRPTDKILLVWSDILEKHTESLQPFIDLIDNFTEGSKTVQVSVGLDNSPRHRFSLNDTGVVPTPEGNGNVAGCYAFNNGRELLKILEFRYRNGFSLNYDEVMKKHDIIDIIQMESEDGEMQIMKPTFFDFIDIGDSSKYTQFMTPERTSTRYFNQILIGSNTVSKKAICDKGIEVMQDEVNFLQTMQSKKIGGFVGIEYFSTKTDGLIDSYTMPKLATTAYDKLKLYNDWFQVKELFDGFCNDIRKIHEESDFFDEGLYSGDTQSRFFDACHNEYVGTTKERVRSIKELLKSANIKRFNGKAVPDFEYMMLRVEDFLKYYTNRNVGNFGLIHGDTNTSNVMYDKFDNMVLIDPRGHFGGEKLFGDKNYDIAKFLYGITGYERLNRHNNFVLDIECENLKDTLGGWDVDYFEHVSQDVKVIVGIIWIKLSAYIINNPQKAIYAYYKGMSILDKALRKLEY